MTKKTTDAPDEEGIASQQTRRAGGVVCVEVPGRLTLSRRTGRAGDLLHILLAPPCLVMAFTLTWVGITRGTLFRGWVLPVLLVAIYAWAWFTATRLFNRRVLTLDDHELVCRDGPIPSLASHVRVPRKRIRSLRHKTSSQRVDIGVEPLRLHHVHLGAEGGQDHVLFENLIYEREATFIVDTLRQALDLS